MDFGDFKGARGLQELRGLQGVRGLQGLRGIQWAWELQGLQELQGVWGLRSVVLSYQELQRLHGPGNSRYISEVVYKAKEVKKL